jgi:hypothetical protein
MKDILIVCGKIEKLIVCGKIEKLKLAPVATENPMWMRSLSARTYIFDLRPSQHRGAAGPSNHVKSAYLILLQPTRAR